jgi:hypothetical protein
MGPNCPPAAKQQLRNGEAEQVAVLKPAVEKVLRCLGDQTDGQVALLTSKTILFTLARSGK